MFSAPIEGAPGGSCGATSRRFRPKIGANAQLLVDDGPDRPVVAPCLQHHGAFGEWQIDRPTVVGRGCNLGHRSGLLVERRKLEPAVGGYEPALRIQPAVVPLGHGHDRAVEREDDSLSGNRGLNRVASLGTGMKESEGVAVAGRLPQPERTLRVRRAR